MSLDKDHSDKESIRGKPGIKQTLIPQSYRGTLSQSEVWSTEVVWSFNVSSSGQHSTNQAKSHPLNFGKSKLISIKKKCVSPKYFHCTELQN